MNGSQIMEKNTGSRKITTWQKAGKKSMVNGITCVLQEVWQRMYGRQGQKVTGMIYVFSLGYVLSVVFERNLGGSFVNGL